MEMHVEKISYLIEIVKSLLRDLELYKHKNDHDIFIRKD